MTLAKAKHQWLLEDGRKRLARAKAEFQEIVDQHFNERFPGPYYRRIKPDK